MNPSAPPAASTRDDLYAPSPFNLAAYVAGPGALRPPHATAITIVEGDRATDWSWAQVHARIAAWQQLLDAYELPQGARVVVFLPNCVDIPAATLAIAGLGLVAVVLSPQLSERELRVICEDAGARLRIGGPERLEGEASRCPVVGGEVLLGAGASDTPRFLPLDPETPGYMVYTSGTTGRPRGVLHAHRAVWARRSMFEGWTGITSEDVVLHAGQLNWTYAMGLAVFDAWAVGARSVIYEGERTPARWAQLFRTQKPSVFAAVPGLFRQLVRDVPELREATASLRHALCAGEPLPPQLWEEWRARTGLELYEALGMSECSTYISSGPITPTRPGSPGRAQPGRRIAILPLDTPAVDALPPDEAGILAIHRSDPGLMLEYFENPEATAKAFRGDWFLTGDVAVLDDDGYLHFQGRHDDTINALGYRVGPAEVEAALSTHPFVSEVAVTGTTPKPGVTLVCAHVVLREGVEWSEDAERALRAHAEQRLAAYKQPRVYRVHEALPRNRSGKVLRRALRD